NREMKLTNRNLGGIDDLFVIVDSRELAKKIHPEGDVSVAALCERYQIDATALSMNSSSLGDARIHAEIYLHLRRNKFGNYFYRFKNNYFGWMSSDPFQSQQQ